MTSTVLVQISIDSVFREYLQYFDSTWYAPHFRDDSESDNW
jgi:hypothetical protein